MSTFTSVDEGSWLTWLPYTVSKAELETPGGHWKQRQVCPVCAIVRFHHLCYLQRLNVSVNISCCNFQQTFSLNLYRNSLVHLFGSKYPEKGIWCVGFSNMYSSTGFMQNALPVLHNVLRLSSLRNANHLKLMESTHIDGNLPPAWLWNICDSSNVIDAAKVKDTQKDRCRGRVG